MEQRFGAEQMCIRDRRKGFGTQPFRPHNVPFVMLGAFRLWFGWFGFNAGSAFAANGTAGYAWVSTLSLIHISLRQLADEVGAMSAP